MAVLQQRLQNGEELWHPQDHDWRGKTGKMVFRSGRHGMLKVVTDRTVQRDTGEEEDKDDAPGQTDKGQNPTAGTDRPSTHGKDDEEGDDPPSN